MLITLKLPFGPPPGNALETTRPLVVLLHSFVRHLLIFSLLPPIWILAVVRLTEYRFNKFLSPYFISCTFVMPTEIFISFLKI